MKIKHKRILALLLLAAMVIGIAPSVLAVGDSAASSTESAVEASGEPAGTQEASSAETDEPRIAPPEATELAPVEEDTGDDDIPRSMDGETLTRDEELLAPSLLGISLFAANSTGTVSKSTCVNFAQYQSPTWYCKTVRTAETAQQTAQAARSTQAAQAAAKAGKQAAESGKKAAKELSQKALQAIIAAGKSLVAALGAGGAIALLTVVVVMLVGILLVSPFGIFFSSGADNEMTLQQAMGILNTEFNDQITEIENSVTHDDLRQDGQQAPWKEVLAIYAVKVTTDKENPMEVVTMDEEHLELLRQIFWDMNQIDYTTETYMEEVTVEVPAEDSTDEDGVTEEVQTVERTRLVITITGKTTLQMAEEYGFDQEQLDLLNELLSEEYANLWFGVPGGSDDIVEVALSQVGNVGGQPYWSWYGFGSRVEWCACFVSWCGDQCGYIEAGTFPKFSYCDAGIAWFKSRGQWQSRGYCPSPGDIIFFDWNNNGVADHVGIVESCDGYYVYTVEGNANDAVKQLRYSVNYSGIEGYGIIIP